MFTSVSSRPGTAHQTCPQWTSQHPQPQSKSRMKESWTREKSCGTSQRGRGAGIRSCLLPALDSWALSGPHQENGGDSGRWHKHCWKGPGRDSGNASDSPGKRGYGGTVPGVAQRGQSPKALPKGLLPFLGRHQGTRSGRCPLGGLKPGRKSRGTGSWRRLVGPSQSFETRNHTRDLSFTSKQVSFSVLSDLDSPRVTCISRTPGPSGIIHTLKCHENAFHGLFRVTNAFIFFPPLGVFAKPVM